MNDLEKQEKIDELCLLLMYLKGWIEPASPWDIKKTKNRGKVSFKTKKINFYAVYCLMQKKYIVETDIEGILEFTKTGLKKASELYKKFLEEPFPIISSLTEQSHKIKSNIGFREKTKKQMKPIENVLLATNAIAFDIMLCGIMMGDILEEVPEGIFDFSEASLKLTHGVALKHLMRKAFENSKTLYIEKCNLIEKSQSVCIWSGYYGLHEFNRLESISGNRINIAEPLGMPKYKGSRVLFYKKIEYKYFMEECQLKRRESNGEWFPFLAGVKAFKLEFISNNFDHLRFSITMDNMETYSKVCILPYLKALRKL